MIEDSNKKQIQIDNNTVKTMTYEQTLEQFKPLTLSIINKWSKYYEKEELQQICCIGMWKAYKTYDIEKKASFGFYAKKIILNDIYQKKNKSKAPLSLNAIMDGNNSEYIDNIQYENNDISNIEDNIAYKMFIKEYMSYLPRKYQIVYKLYYEERYTQAEIASFLNCTQPAISYLLRQLIIYIKKMYEIDKVIKYFPANNLRNTIKQLYVSDNIESYINNATYYKVKEIISFLSQGLEKMEHDYTESNIESSCTKWLNNVYKELNKF